MRLALPADGRLPASRLAGLALAVLTLLGCRPYTASYVCNAYGNPHGRIMECHVRESEITYWVGPPGPPAMPRSPRDSSPVPAPTFDPPSARATLDRVDLSPCRAEGVPDGYGHARLTVRSDGTVSTVLIDAPAGMTTQAVACLGRELGAARIAPFEGNPITIGTTFLVRPPANAVSSR